MYAVLPSYWAVFFSHANGWRYHPGYRRSDSLPPITMEHAATEADLMLEKLLERFPNLEAMDHGFVQCADTSGGRSSRE